MKYRITFGVLALATWSAFISAKESSINDVFLASLINEIKESANLHSGTAIAVVVHDKIIYHGDFGHQDIENNIAVNPNTQFYIASATKPFTALNFLIDANNDESIRDTTLSTMFPSIQVKGREDITAKHLLTHTASINNLPLVLATAYSGEHFADTRLGLVNALSEPSEEAIGEFKYTNVGYNIYSVFSDQFFKQDWQTKLHKQIFVSAGMNNTAARRSSIKADSSDPKHGNIARPYSVMNHDRQTSLYLEKQDSTLHAAGGMFSTSHDLARFLMIQLNHGALEDRQIFPSKVIKESQTQQVSTDTAYLDFERDGYAWGWYTGDYKNNRMLHHFGGFAGTHAHLSFMPEQGIGLVVLNNEDFLSARLTSLIADYIYGALLNEENIEQKITQRAQLLSAKLAGLDNMLEKERAKISARKWNLSLTLNDYVGEYQHPLLGTITVSANKAQRLDVTWGQMHSSSTGMNEQDKIRVELEPASGSVITFNVSNKVNSLTFSDIEFKKI
ncbi:serine hydrolase [Alteromonas sp. D210916BOD_24]|uniref:serine hydrolase domain-containing protein n=1 Tax=Alteromonas sp. D210916BOD_24 TaxID=3157618 RepID=UPI00399CF445